MPYERARTLLVQGQVLRRLKRKREARSALDEAAAIFARLGADGWVARVAAERLRVASRRAPDGLTASELRVAELAAEGPFEPRDSSAGVRLSEDGRGDARAGLPEARDLARAASSTVR